MKTIRFHTYGAYLRAQKKSLEGKTMSFHWPGESQCLLDWYNSQKLPYPKSILCHGVRFGQELELFKQTFKPREIIGTDLVVQSSGVVEWDFRFENPKWSGKFDLVYSNSLDHSNDPETTLRVWIEQLNPKGHLVVNWTPWHTRLGKGDCFSATLDEYYELLFEVGQVKDLIRCQPKWFLFVVGK